MPVVIIAVALLILGWSQWSNRQSIVAVSGQVEGMITDLCAGEPLESIRWGDALVREAVTEAVDALCSTLEENRTVVAVAGSDAEDPFIEVRIALDSRNVMTLEVEQMSDGILLVRGWSSE